MTRVHYAAEEIRCHTMEFVPSRNTLGDRVWDGRADLARVRRVALAQ